VFVAIVTVLAVVLAVYAFGRAVADDSDGVAVTGTGDGSAAADSGDTTGDAAGADAGHSHDGDTADAAAAPTEEDFGLRDLENGQMTHDYGADQPLDNATRTELARQLSLTREVADKYPTLQTAVDSGRFRAGPFVPGLGTHMVGAGSFDPDGVIDDSDARRPQTIIYDGLEPDAPIAGFMYYSTSKEEPEGFAGPNDHWHYHENVCIRPGTDGLDAPLGADREVTAAQCKAVGGNLMPETQWMVHVWTIPGYESNRGVFSDVNPAIACSDGTYFTVPEADWTTYLKNICKNSPS
jgi:hypothetical protein